MLVYNRVGVDLIMVYWVLKYNEPIENLKHLITVEQG